MCGVFPCLAPSRQKSPAPNESRQAFGRVTANLLLTADRFKMDPSQKKSASAVERVCAELKIYRMYVCTHLDRKSVYVANLEEEVQGKEDRATGQHVSKG